MKYLFDFIIYILAVFIGSLKERKKKFLFIICIVLSIGLFGIKSYINFHEDKTNDKKIDQLLAKIDQQSEQIKKLQETILSKFLEEQKDRPDVYAKAEKLYNLGMSLANQGRDKKAAQAFLAFREIAIQQKDYIVAAGASIIAAWHLEDADEKIKSAKLKEEAGDFYMEAYNIKGLEVLFGQARKWKLQAAEMYQKEGLKNKANQLYKSIEH